MRYYRIETDEGPHLLARDGDEAFDLTAARPGVTDFSDLAHVADVASTTVDAVAADLRDDARAVDPPAQEALSPAVDEVWAAGVTYAISEQAREAESGMPEMYLDVYDADRPEIFFKAPGRGVVGPGDVIGVRGDSEWNVPEPELGIVLHRGDIVGYTVGNDVSSRDIEGANPLYLPQAKVYDRSCALGPCVATPSATGDPHDLRMSMTIERDGETVYEEATTTGEMVRTCEELVDYLTRHYSVPETTVLLTGTSLVPEEGFSLSPGDDVHIDIEGIGRLVNSTVEV
jgi:2-dehydro-3-deoxy-D-arabinonate dehydratase